MLLLERSTYNKVMGIYIIKNNINSRVYIGSTINLYNRCSSHRSLLRDNKHYNNKLQEFVNMYGIESLYFEIIEIINEVRDLTKREQFYIDFYNSSQTGFNLSPSADGTSGFKYSEESRRKIGEKSKNRVFSEETLKRMSESQIGRCAGEKHHLVKLKNDQVIEIKKMLKCGFGGSEISKYFGVNFRTIYNIKSGIRWSHIPDVDTNVDDFERFDKIFKFDDNTSVRCDSKLSINNIKYIKYLLINSNNLKETKKMIKNNYNLSYTNISQISLNKIYKYVEPEYIETEKINLIL